MVGTANVGATGKAPSAGAAELLGLAHEAVELLRNPKPKEVAALAKEYAANKAEAAQERKAAAEQIAEADRKLAALAAAKAAHAAKVAADTEALENRQLDVSGREGRARRKEDENTQVSAHLLDRETAVSDRERRLQRQAEAALDLVK